MDLIPHEELKPSHNFNFAPMIDFLFLMLALFATLAVSRAALYDSEIELVRLKEEKGSAHRKGKEAERINITISGEGKFKWLTEFQEYEMGSVEEIQEELLRQHQGGALPQDKEKTEILLHIDRKAPWDPIAKAIFAIREAGFNARPVYDATP